MFDSAALTEAVTDHFLPHCVWYAECLNFNWFCLHCLIDLNALACRLIRLSFCMYLDPSTMGCCKKWAKVP
jgi:hypothetical protein